MQVGNIVLYVDEFDSDKSYSPNMGPALVTKVHSNGELDLAVFAQNGMFFKTQVKQGAVDERRTWHPK